MLFGFVPFKTSPLFALMLVSPLSFFCCLVCSPTTFFFLSFFFFLSLSQALGKPKPRLGFGFPLVFSACWTRTSTTTRPSSSASSPRRRPRTLLFFFSSASSSFLGLLVGIMAVGCVLIRFFFLVVGCCSGSVCSLFALHARCIMHL